jgi:hypothetical protein
MTPLERGIVEEARPSQQRAQVMENARPTGATGSGRTLAEKGAEKAGQILKDLKNNDQNDPQARVSDKDLKTLHDWIDRVKEKARQFARAKAWEQANKEFADATKGMTDEQKTKWLAYRVKELYNQRVVDDYTNLLKNLLKDDTVSLADIDYFTYILGKRFPELASADRPLEHYNLRFNWKDDKVPGLPGMVAKFIQGLKAAAGRLLAGADQRVLSYKDFVEKRELLVKLATHLRDEIAKLKENPDHKITLTPELLEKFDISGTDLNKIFDSPEYRKTPCVSLVMDPNAVNGKYRVEIGLNQPLDGFWGTPGLLGDLKAAWDAAAKDAFGAVFGDLAVPGPFRVHTRKSPGGHSEIGGVAKHGKDSGLLIFNVDMRGSMGGNGIVGKARCFGCFFLTLMMHAMNDGAPWGDNKV